MEKVVNYINITTTATIRPEILDRTYKSFCDNLFNKECRYKLIINIDPIGDKRYSQNDVLNIAKKYFDNIVFNFPSAPSFAKAVKWCWSNVDADYVFHLEDDWVCNEKISIISLINIINKYDVLAMIRLYKGMFAHRMKPISPIGIKEEHKGIIQYLPKRCSLNPGLFLGRYAKEASVLMVDHLNPESQLCGNCSGIKNIEEFVDKWGYSVYGYGRRVVSDIGIRWRKEKNIRRKPDFTEWEINT